MLSAHTPQSERERTVFHHRPASPNQRHFGRAITRPLGKAIQTSGNSSKTQSWFNRAEHRSGYAARSKHTFCPIFFPPPSSCGNFRFAPAIRYAQPHTAPLSSLQPRGPPGRLPSGECKRCCCGFQVVKLPMPFLRIRKTRRLFCHVFASHRVSLAMFVPCVGHTCGKVGQPLTRRIPVVYNSGSTGSGLVGFWLAHGNRCAELGKQAHRQYSYHRRRAQASVAIRSCAAIAVMALCFICKGVNRYRSRVRWGKRGFTTFKLIGEENMGMILHSKCIIKIVGIEYGKE